MSKPIEVEGLFAFWSYDTFPYILGAEFTSIKADGCAFAPSYQGWVRPLLILPLQDGEILYDSLKDLKKEYEGDIDTVKEAYSDKLVLLVPGQLVCCSH